MEGNSALPVKSLSLEYGTDKRAIFSEVNRVQPPFGQTAKINSSYTWEMKKTGSLPPGAQVWWQWRVIDEAGRTYVTPSQQLIFEDTRYKWQVKVVADMDIYWHSQDATLINELTAAVEAKLARIKLEVVIPKERKPKVFIYTSSEQIKSAILFSQEWTGALAFPSYNIILSAVNSTNLEWAKTALPHELTHLLVGEAVFGAFGDIPTWLNEGLARYSEGEMSASDRQILDNAIKGGTLLSVKSLGSSFPADATQAYLAYAESSSLVSYLIDTYGWEKMRALLSVFKDGSTYDNGLKKVYGFDISGLEKQWKAKIDAS